MSCEVSGVIDKMLSKRIINSRFLKNVADSNTNFPTDPRVSMNARRLQVIIYMFWSN